MSKRGKRNNYMPPPPLTMDELPERLPAELFDDLCTEPEPKKRREEAGKRSIYERCGDLFLQKIITNDYSISVDSLSNSETCSICKMCVDDPVNWQKYNKAIHKLPDDQAVELLRGFGVVLEKGDLKEHRAHYSTDVSDLLDKMLKTEYENYRKLQTHTSFTIESDDGGEPVTVPNFCALSACNGLSASIRHFIKLKTDLQTPKGYRHK
ncbi:hypothetical protein [Ranid herpesvirus 3]|uniref:Uncharacterized protein n=1 Tax=Ranid herpesvirus 3 TaxID=1987509 RepID=A0A1X9T5C0_9VIRU|nr:hypothetical protein [Ranid herpesvirus 3]ARR28898.1 hypothetical protein [Ranid herpesvirus 3]